MAGEPESPDPFDLRLPDGGPRYTETPPDPGHPAAPLLAEPWNAASAFLFVAVSAAWLWRLRGRRWEHPFLSCCLPILLAGGVGGTLYHAFRRSYALFLLDIIPITLLGLGGSLYVLVRVGRATGWRAAAGFAAGAGAVYVLVNVWLLGLLRARGLGWDPHFEINLEYATLAGLVAAPALALLARTRFRHAGWIAAAVVSFGIAFFCRVVDRRAGEYLTMGTHWLWHAFGALTTALVIEFFYRVEVDLKWGTPPAGPLPPGRGPE